VLVASVIFGLSSVPGDATPQVSFPFADKLAHFVEYFALGAACARGLRRGSGLPARRQHRAGLSAAVVVLAAALAASYGILDEVHQLFVPGRTSDWRDSLADALGALVGAFLFEHLSHRREARAIASKFQP
jgi:VanZ family protein